MRIKVNTNPVANNYAQGAERIIEFSHPEFGGGLISFTASHGRLVVDLYRIDDTVDIRLPADRREEAPTKIDGAVPRSAERAQFLADIIVTAVEGGINYWAEVDDYRWYFPEPDCLANPAMLEAGPDNTSNARVDVRDQEEQESRFTRVDLDSIEQAVQTLARTVPEIAAANVTNDGGDIDATLADMIMQNAVLGEVIYG